MSSPNSPDLPLRDLPAWIVRQIIETEDGRALLERIGLSLRAAGIQVRLIGFGAPSLSVIHRGVFLAWRPGAEVQINFARHGEIEHERSPIEVAVDAGLTFKRWNLSLGEGCAEISLLNDLRNEGCTEYLLDIVNFPAGTSLRGVALFYVTDRPGGFTDADVTALKSLREASSLFVWRLGLTHALINMLDAYVGARTTPLVLNGRVRRGEGELIEAAILLVDLKGFTELADRADPLRLVEWLDEHLDALGRDVTQNGGEIFKFTGDGFIAAFPANGDAMPCSACTGALAAARGGLSYNRALQASRRAAGEPWLAADLALHFGRVVYGNIGTADRLDFTAIGRAVNEASRIEHLCDATNRNLLISDSFARRCATDLIEVGAYELRGVETPRRLWTVGEA